MGSREIFLSGRIRAPEVLKRACRLGVLAALVLGFAPSRAAAQNTLSGCQTITLAGTYSLQTGGITASTSPCLIVASDNVTINLSGQALDMTTLGDIAVAISVGDGTTSYVNTTISNGTISTAYTSSLATGAAIEINGGSGLSISGVTVQNLPNSGTACAQTSNLDQNYGTGISISGVTGGTIGPNKVTCYQTGLSVANSSVAKGASGTISGNTLEWNTYYMGGGNQVASGGLVLSNSSGWTVSNNTIEFNGSADPNGTCLTSGTVLTCMAGLQVINGSSGNSISPNNSASSNFVVGIMTGSDTAKNSITSNTALNNGLYDLYEVGHGHGNSFRTNTCATVGGNLSLRACQ
jgi:hypothetical protein